MLSKTLHPAPCTTTCPVASRTSTRMHTQPPTQLQLHTLCIHTAQQHSITHSPRAQLHTPPRASTHDIHNPAHTARLHECCCLCLPPPTSRLMCRCSRWVCRGADLQHACTFGAPERHTGRGKEDEEEGLFKGARHTRWYTGWLDDRLVGQCFMAKCEGRMSKARLKKVAEDQKVDLFAAKAAHHKWFISKRLLQRGSGGNLACSSWKLQLPSPHFEGVAAQRTHSTHCGGNCNGSNPKTTNH